jgi:hypothetical protein
MRNQIKRIQYSSGDESNVVDKSKEASRRAPNNVNLYFRN